MIDDGTLLIANSTVIAGIFIFMAVIATLDLGSLCFY